MCWAERATAMWGMSEREIIAAGPRRTLREVTEKDVHCSEEVVAGIKRN